jgi:hypothetical protein
MLLARRCAHLALALLLSVFAVVPHGHDGLQEHARQGVTNLGTCDAPEAQQHLHASEEQHAKPCVACVRHHSAGALSPLGAAAEPFVHSAVFNAANAFAVAASVVFTPLRAPPVSR